MNTARIVVLAIAPGGGGVAAHLASGFDSKSSLPMGVAQLKLTAKIETARFEMPSSTMTVLTQQ